MFRLLEWDYGSDIGYVEGQQTQVEAAQSLSTLEKLAIGNYSDILKDSDGAEDPGRRRPGAAASARASRLPLESMEVDADAKMKMFAQSLIRQRELRQNETRSRRKSSSPKRNPVGVEADTEQGVENKQVYADTKFAVAPVIRRQSVNQDREAVSSPEKIRTKNGRKMRRSSSLSELNVPTDLQSLVSRSASNSQMSHQAGSGPSSSSSCGTVVHSRQRVVDNRTDEQSADDILDNVDINVDAAHLGEQLSKLCRTSRQSSKRSMSTSFETVIAAASGKDSFEADEEHEAPTEGSHQNARRGPMQDGVSINDPTFRNSEVVGLDNIPPPPPLQQHQEVSGNSSAPSTSDEDVNRQQILNVMVHRLDQRETGGDTSTLDSVQMIDRAKSFEYIPGESFPIQENSSSYEYLPGHLVPEQRPPTVLNLSPHPSLRHRRQDNGDSSNARDTASLSRPQPVPSGSNVVQNASPLVDRAHDQELDQIAKDLKGKSKELYAVNISMTKHFYKKLRRYLDFLATPSNSVAECRIKQQLAVKISKMLATEESRLEQSSDQSRQHGGGTSSDQSRQEALQSSSSSGSPPQNDGQGGGSDASLRDGSKKDLQRETAKVNASGRINWRAGKTKSEERYEKNHVDSTNESIEGADLLNKKRAEHLRILKRELKILERLERENKKENVATNSTKSTSINSTKSSNLSSSGPTHDIPTRKLSYNKRSQPLEDVSKIEGEATRTRDSTTITDFALSKDTTDKKDETKTLTENEKNTENEDYHRHKRERRKKKLSKVVDRGTQMTATETEMSSVISQSESEYRASRKKQQQKRKTGGKKDAFSSCLVSSRTDTLKIHATFESESRESSVRAGVPCPPGSSPDLPSYSSQRYSDEQQHGNRHQQYQGPSSGYPQPSDSNQHVGGEGPKQVGHSHQHHGIQDSPQASSSQNYHYHTEQGHHEGPQHGGGHSQQQGQTQQIQSHRQQEHISHQNRQGQRHHYHHYPDQTNQQQYSSDVEQVNPHAVGRNTNISGGPSRPPQVTANHPHMRQDVYPPATDPRPPDDVYLSAETTTNVSSSVDTIEQIYIRKTTHHHWNKENMPERKRKVSISSILLKLLWLLLFN